MQITFNLWRVGGRGVLGGANRQNNRSTPRVNFSLPVTSSVRGKNLIFFFNLSGIFASPSSRSLQVPPRRNIVMSACGFLTFARRLEAPL